MIFTVYLSGEIHTDWREEIRQATHDMNIAYTAPVTDHPASDAAGDFLGLVEPGFWRDQQSSGVNAIRTRYQIDRADLVVVRFGDKYKQWNAAFDAGYCVAKQIPFITLHDDSLVHPLKEVDQAAYAWCKTTDQVAKIMRYVLSQR